MHHKDQNNPTDLLLELLTQQCKARDIILTSKRLAILRVIAEAADHPAAEEIHRRAAIHDRRISIGTVYRAIRLFEKHNVIHRMNLGNGRARFEATTHAEHCHLIDTASGTVLEFNDPQIDALYGEIARRLGYRLLSREIKLYGQPTGQLGFS